MAELEVVRLSSITTERVIATHRSPLLAMVSVCLSSITTERVIATIITLILSMAFVSLSSKTTERVVATSLPAKTLDFCSKSQFQNH